MTALTVLVGLACATLALTVAKGDATAAGLLFGVAGTALGSFIKQPQKAGSEQIPRDKESGRASPTVIFVCLFAGLAFMLAFLLLPRTSRAEGWETVSPGVYKSGAWTAHPNFTVSAGQINVKAALDSGLFSGQAIERVALGGG
jgi:hypothetical protein